MPRRVAASALQVSAARLIDFFITERGPAYAILSGTPFGRL